MRVTFSLATAAILLVPFLSAGQQADPKDEATALAQGCDAGRLKDCAHLADMYHYGKGVPEDHNKGYALTRKALEGGGIMSVRLSLDLTDVAKATEMSRKACEAGDGQACHDLAGIVLSHSPACTANCAENETLVRVRLLFEKACEKAMGAGCFNAAVMNRYGEGAQPNEERAAELFRKACTAGFAYGCSAAEKLRR